jgi:predicted O-linked N-acetylglucosamine transferase (SPINDLY family)
MPDATFAAQALRQALNLHRAGRLDEAEAVYRRLLSSYPQHFDTLHFLGVLRAQRGDMAEAAALIGKALERKSDEPFAHFHLAGALLPLGRAAEALASYGRAVALKPDFVEAHAARAAILLEMHRHEEALEACDRAIALQPDFMEAHNNRGTALLELGLREEALAAFQWALALKPDFAQTYYNLGNTLLALGRHDGALAAFDSALTLKPDYGEALYNRSSVLDKIGRAEESLTDSDKALEVNPKLGLAASRSFFARAMLCDWRGRDERISDLTRRCREGQALGLYVNCAFDDPELLLLTAKTKAGASKRIMPSRPVRRHERLRVAYLSPDFRDHPVAHQAVELFERHDRTRFETYGVCLRAGPESAIRQRLRRAFDHFEEAGERSDPEIARLLADSQIDIAVDLGGYTDEGRTNSLSFRPAPIAVNYLGYPGTLGADYVDYIIADAQVIPPGAEGFYSEKIARLPDCFMPNDTKDRASPTPPPRAEAGLPQTGFVFCAFNNAYKIAPQMFDVWMGLLRAVDASVLWLSIGNEKARNNLRAEAEARRVSPERLVFADRIEERGRHLARLGLADLFLDTLPYNAHSTASDILWAGVPLVTCMGRSFASRVAGSLLTAIGAEELIAPDLGAYETLALDLARSPERLAASRANLVRNRTSYPLFDMARLCRHLESAYETMWGVYLKGRKPESFMVNALTD